MKKTLFLLLCMAGITAAMGSEWVNIRHASAKPVNISLVSSANGVSVVKFAVDGFSLNAVNTAKGTAYTVSIEGSTPLLEKGCPDLPKVATSLIISDLDEMKAEVISSKFRDFPNMVIAPSKGNLSRDIDPASIGFVYGKVYTKNAFWPKSLTDTRTPYIIRDYRGQTILANMFAYNPVTKTLRVYYDVTVKFSKTGKTGQNPLYRNHPLKSINTEFNSLYSNQFLNYKSVKYTPLDEHGRILIIAHAAFIPAMQPYINWKISEGIPTQIVDVATIGGVAAIKSYVSTYFNDPGLTYLLLVGDHQQVPTILSTAGDSDNSYGYLAGNDHYPDIFVGRFSGENAEHIATQVAKVLYYEINPDTTTNWLRHGIGLASSQGPGDDNELDYEHIRNLSSQIKTYTYDSVTELFDGSQGSFDAAGDPSPAQVSADVNAGAGVILYTGHGSDNSWGTSGFSSSQVNQLTNYGKLPFIWSVACVNGNFTNGTCFAEAWLRARQGTQLTGAVATLMSTINQSWNPPMDAEDEMVSILTESYTNNIKRTFGGISMNGCMKMNDDYGTSGDEMTDTWNLFGDPSLMVRTAVPAVMTVSHNPTAFLGTTQFQVNCSKEGALACITLNHEILGTGIILGGSTTINFTYPLSTIDTLTVVVTAYNYLPYIGEAMIIAASGPFMAMQSYTFSDVTGNNNNYPDFGETVGLDVNLQNMGVALASGVTANLTSNCPFITITDNTQIYGDILAGANNNQLNAYSFAVQNNIVDMSPATFTVNITDNNGGSWTSNFTVFLHAPALQATKIIVNDASGNADGFLDPGETADLIISTKNTGHAPTVITLSSLASVFPGLTLNNTSANLGIIAPAATTDATFNVSLSNSASLGSTISLDFAAIAGAYSAQHAYMLPVGKVSEDFESNSFGTFAWTQSGDVPWTISNVTPYEGIYCAKSGLITDSQSSTLSVTMEVISEDSISFFRKVSSEFNYDFLQFFVDQTKVQEWSGNVPWQKVAYLISPGLHTFSWKYMKDDYMTSGSDAAWIDYILFPPVNLGITGIATPNAGNDIKLYPNPANDQVNLEIKLQKASNVLITITDILGNEVGGQALATTLTAGTHHVKLGTSELKSGVYLMKIKQGNNVETRKLIISR